ncbi:MAG: restriction endonuclease, partial [Clostridia bacterium]|nr:restriction endonuclease [Clostridia bacterium]
EGALMYYGMSQQDIGVVTATNKGGRIRSYIATTFNDLLMKKNLIREGDGYVLAKEELIIVTEDQCEAQILTLLHKNSRTKNEIYAELEKSFKIKSTLSNRDDIMLRTVAGVVIANLVSENRIEYDGSKYCERRQTAITDSDSTPLPEEEFKKKLFKRLWFLGGSHFEKFCSNVLEKYFSMIGQFVVYCDITGGSEDGGIDIIIETIDRLGFYEKMMVQTKCRDHTHVTEKEVREFYGALNVLGGSRGIYITSTTFHENAQKVLDSVNNCIGIDGDKLFELIKETGYGITKTKNGCYLLDPAIFTR